MFQTVVVRRVVEIVVEPDMLTVVHRIVMGIVMNILALDRAGPQISMMPGVCVSSGMAVRVMARAECASHESAKVRGVC